MTQSHMAREIAEIPEAARRFLDGSRDAVLAAAAALRDRAPVVVTTVARGSSDHAATYLKYAIELEQGLPVASLGPSIASIYGRPLHLAQGACIGISQSGRSPDIVEMLREVGIAVESMSSPTAARSYNVTVAEGRRVACALLPL